MKWNWLLGACLALASSPALPQEPDPSGETLAKFKAYKVVLVGDSTMQALSGWGGSFCARRVAPMVACVNLGRGGRSTKTYIAEGAWKLARNEMTVPGYARVWVLIQFGHNDQGRHSRSTDLATEFPANLRKYVSETRAAGAMPILVTPLTRRTFEDGKITRDLDPWSAAVRSVAAEMRVPLVDLNARSTGLVQAMGPVVASHLAETHARADTLMAAIRGNSISEKRPASTASPTTPPAANEPRLPHLEGSFDYTHLGELGANLFAMIVASELAREVPEMRPMLFP